MGEVAMAPKAIAADGAETAARIASRSIDSLSSVWPVDGEFGDAAAAARLRGVVAAWLGLADGAVVGGASGLLGLGLGQWVVLPLAPEVATQPLVGFDLCQLLLATAIRPSTTHHFLELAAPLERGPLVEA